jgi:hypothetical protein
MPWLQGTHLTWNCLQTETQKSILRAKRRAQAEEEEWDTSMLILWFEFPTELWSYSLGCQSNNHPGQAGALIDL